MVNMTLSIPKELKEIMDKFPEMNWSEVARQAFLQKIRDLEFLIEFKSKSTFTEDDALRLGKRVNQSLAKRYQRAA